MKVLEVRQGEKPIKAWIDHVEVEREAAEQLHNVAKMPFIYKHVAAMPDVHWGMGATVGSVIATKGAVIPAAVGVDIGCGMIAEQLYGLTANDLPDNLHAMREAIEAAVPVGRTNNGQPGDRGSWQNPRPAGLRAWNTLGDRYRAILEKHSKIKARHGNDDQSTIGHMGTLGSGNHFIELCLDEDQNVWVMLHSGSRGVGNRIGQYFIEMAKQDMRRHFINLPDQDLAYLPEGTTGFDDYVEAVSWAQDYAANNRMVMMTAVTRVVRDFFPIEHQPVRSLAISCHHNYIARENHFGENVLVTRKGAVRARRGDLGIIPGSMGAKSYIVLGLGNPDSFMSCSHGAGRAMSRSEAKRRFTLEDHAAAVAGVECRVDESVIDETPGAYKDIDAVMQSQGDLVQVVHTLKQVLCVKG